MSDILDYIEHDDTEGTGENTSSDDDMFESDSSDFLLDDNDMLVTPDDSTSEDSGAPEDIVALDMSSDDLNVSDAQEITDAIKSTVTATYVLLARAHEGRAYKALGYETWEDYVTTEFDFSTQRSYQLLDLAKTVRAIESVAPQGYESKLTEAQARDIKRELPKITERIAEETHGKSADESAEIIETVVQEAREQKKADQKALEEKRKQEEENAEEQRRAALDAEADKFLEEHDSAGGLGEGSSDNDDSLFNDSNGASYRESSDAVSLQNFFTVISGFDSLPEPETMIDLIPQEREDSVLEIVSELKSWFERFETLWNERK